ncbi:MAG TPA: hypothetical protein VFC62_05010 [Atopostipes sp.]|nr:hypothetical protein [Atopostipes sp.]
MAVKTKKKRKLSSRQQKIYDAHKAKIEEVKSEKAKRATPKPKVLSMSVVQAMEAVQPG